MPRPDVAPVVYYVTGHGYGHGVRSADIVRGLHRLRPDLPIVVVSDLPQVLLRNRIGPGPSSFRHAAFDVGMVQHDSIRSDLEATLEQLDRLAERTPELIEGEKRYLSQVGASLVVADIPGIPLLAARELGLPRIAVGNFGWDWIYAAHAAKDPRWERASRAYMEAYASADLLLRLPFAEPMAAFPLKEDIPVVASPGRARREELARLTGADAANHWVLLAFTTLDWDEQALERVTALEGHAFFTVRPLAWDRSNIHPVDRERMPFSDVLASVDSVITKPGYGILSDCVVNAKPLIYADREDFVEYPVLVAAIRRYFRHHHIPAAHLYRGELREALEAIRSSPAACEPCPTGGAEVAARRLLEHRR